MARIRMGTWSLLLVFAGWPALGGQDGGAAQQGGAAPPEAQPPQEDANAAVWSYLAERHDHDGDGRITREEYGRGETGFQRLDFDGDGVVTPADLDARESESKGPSEEERQGMITSAGAALLARCFGEGRDSLQPGMVERRFAEVDADGDGAVTRAELDADLARQGAAPFKIMGMDRFAMLAAASAGPEAGTLRLHDLLGLLASQDRDGDGALAGPEYPDMGKVGRRPRPNEDEKNARAAAGREAPDFSLPRADGSGTVTLSGFAGQRPVALIFGSFT